MTLYICDTPGFADNRGIEIDLANGIGMLDALSSVNSARIVVLMSKSSIEYNRFKGATEIGNILTKMFYNF